MTAYEPCFTLSRTVKCSDLNKEGTPGLVVTRGSSRRFSIFEKIKKRKHASKK